MICPYCKTDLLVKNPKTILHHCTDHILRKDKLGWYLLIRDENISIGKSIIKKPNYYISIFDKEYEIPPLKISDSVKKINSFKKLLAFI